MAKGYISNDITDRKNSYTTTSLKEKWINKFDTRSVLNASSSIVKAPVFTPYKDEVNKVLKYACKAYMLKTSQLQNGTIVYDGRPYTASNLPVRARFDFYWGYYMYQVLKASIRGRVVKDIISSVPNTPVDVFSSYYDFPDDFNEKAASGTANVFTSYVGTVKNPQALISDLYEKWQANLNAAISNLLTAYSDLIITDPASFGLCVDVSKQLSDVLGRIRYKRNDERFATYLVSILQNYSNIYARVFGDQDVKDPKYVYLASKILNLRDHMLNPAQLFDDFKSWLDEKLYMEDFEKEASLLKLDFQKGFKYSMQGGTISLDTHIFEQIVDMAGEGTSIFSQTRNDVLYQLERFEKVYDELAQSYTILCLNKQNSKIPLEIGLLIPRSTFDVNVGKDWSAYIESCNKTVEELDLILPYYVSFVKENFYRAEGKRLFPNVAVRKRLFNGLDEYYRFHLFTPQQRAYTVFKISDYRAKKLDKTLVTLVDMFAVGGSNVFSHDDGPGLSYLNANYVSSTLEQVYVDNWVDQLLYHRLFRVSEEVYRAEFDDHFMTIKPNGLGKKPPILIRYDQNSVRETNTYDYEATPVDVQPDLSTMTLADKGKYLLDLWFGYAYHECMDPAMFESMYLSRLGQMGTPTDVPVATEYTHFVGERKTDINWKALSSCVGTRFDSFKKNTYYLPLVHSFTKVDDVCDSNGMRTLSSSMDRYVKIPVPVPKDTLSKRMIDILAKNPASKGRVEIAHSLDMGWDYDQQKSFNRFVLTNELFDAEKGALPESLLGFITLDLATDVKWGCFYGLTAPNIKNGAKRFSFKVKPPISAAECVDVEQDDRIVVFAGVDNNAPADSFKHLRVVDDWNELFSSTLQHNDILITIGNCLRNILLEIFEGTVKAERDKDQINAKAYAKAKSDLTTVLSYISRYYDTASEVLLEGAYGTVVFDDFKKDCINTQPSYSKVVEYFEKLYGTDATLRAEKPAFDYYTYDAVLRASENGEVLLPRTMNTIEFAKPIYSRYDFKNIDTLAALDSFYVSRKLNSLAKEAIK